MLVELQQEGHSHVAPLRPVIRQRRSERRRQLKAKLLREVIHLALRGRFTERCGPAAHETCVLYDHRSILSGHTDSGPHPVLPPLLVCHVTLSLGGG